MKNPAELYKTICSVICNKVGDDVDYCIYRENRSIYCLFKETDSRRDWEVNFNFPAKLYKHQDNDFKVARGWGNAYKTANDQIMNNLKDVLDLHSDQDGWDNLNVIFAGWSYGGAMAQLAAEDFYYRFNKKSYCITFGAPKVLYGKKTKNYFLSTVESAYNYEHVNDIVPLVPPFPGYTVMQRVKIGSNKCFFKLFDPCVYHCIYGEESLY